MFEMKFYMSTSV